MFNVLDILVVLLLFI